MRRGSGPWRALGQVGDEQRREQGNARNHALGGRRGERDQRGIRCGAYMVAAGMACLICTLGCSGAMAVMRMLGKRPVLVMNSMERWVIQALRCRCVSRHSLQGQGQQHQAGNQCAQLGHGSRSVCTRLARRNSRRAGNSSAVRDKDLKMLVGQKVMAFRDSKPRFAQFGGHLAGINSRRSRRAHWRVGTEIDHHQAPAVLE